MISKCCVFFKFHSRVCCGFLVMKPTTWIFCVCKLQNSFWRMKRNNLETLYYFCNASSWSSKSVRSFCCATQPALQWVFSCLLTSLVHCPRGFSHPNLTAAVFPCLCSGRWFCLVPSASSTSHFLKQDICAIPCCPARTCCLCPRNVVMM